MKQTRHALHLRGFTGALIVAAVLNACAVPPTAVPTAPPAPSTAVTGNFAGRVDGSDAFIAVSAFKERGEVMAYACDSKTVAEWFRGAAIVGDDVVIGSGFRLPGTREPSSNGGVVVYRLAKANESVSTRKLNW